MSIISLKFFKGLFYSNKDKYYKEVYSLDDVKEAYSNRFIYHKIKSQLRGKNPRISLEPICPLDKSNFDGILFSELKQSFGRARVRYNIKIGQKKVKILLFKNIFAGFKTSITAHFYKRKIFNLRYEFKMKDRSEYEQIGKLISLKYLNGEPIDLQNDYLVDEYNTVLSFATEFSLVLNYHNNSEFFNYIDYLIDDDELAKQNKQYSRYKKLYKKL